MTRGVCIVSLALFLIAGGTAQTPTPAPRGDPRVAARQGKASTVLVSHLPRRRLSALTATESGHNIDSIGAFQDFVLLRNRGRRPCDLSGTPIVQPLDPRRQPIAFTRVTMPLGVGRCQTCRFPRARDSAADLSRPRLRGL